MDPEDVIIPEVLTEGTPEEITQRAREMCQLLHDLDPFLVALAVIFQESQSESDLEAFLALDARRIEVDNVFYQQLTVMRNLNIPRGVC